MISTQELLVVIAEAKNLATTAILRIGRTREDLDELHGYVLHGPVPLRVLERHIGPDGLADSTQNLLRGTGRVRSLAIAAFIEEHGVTQAAAAELLGISPQRLSQLLDRS